MPSIIGLSGGGGGGGGGGDASAANQTTMIADLVDIQGRIGAPGTASATGAIAEQLQRLADLLASLDTNIANIEAGQTLSAIAGAETLIVGATAQTIAAMGGTIPAGTGGAYIGVEINDIRAWFGGDTPTTTDGMLIKAGERVILMSSSEVSTVSFISQSGSNATVQIQYMG